jgi:hypothetical protein
MGLLDEAIRDHLELKRRRGADPTEIAREQSEALDPVFPAEPVAADRAAPQGQPDDSPTAAEGEQGLEQTQPGASTIGQETAELDMQSVLDGDAQPAGTLHAGGTAEEELEWEMPDSSTADPPPEPLPGQERLSFE